MSLGRDPRMLFKELISPDTLIPTDLDEMTLWGLLANFITEPPKRKKLNHINSIDDVVHLLKTSKKIMVLTGAGVRNIYFLCVILFRFMKYFFSH